MHGARSALLQHDVVVAQVGHVVAVLAVVEPLAFRESDDSAVAVGVRPGWVDLEAASGERDFVHDPFARGGDHGVHEAPRAHVVEPEVADGFHVGVGVVRDVDKDYP